MPGRWVPYHKHGRMPALYPSTRKEIEQTMGTIEESLFFPKQARSSPGSSSTEVVPETQCGFRGNRSTVDMIFCLGQLQEKCIEQDRPL
ncbi:hypothetical protein NP493_1165g01047 [Ridgeia piscesae]|uniref:Uncharacterized protein n=1 Tax=Ridgeia piscesae TaxID=27915 RepID=A0AAD9NK31_RIDPI|nr:hypothetical protein NP493_1165g01047 [Ridgeia piscesae]